MWRLGDRGSRGLWRGSELVLWAWVGQEETRQSLLLGPGEAGEQPAPGRHGAKPSLKEPKPAPPPLSKISISKYQTFGAIEGISLRPPKGPGPHPKRTRTR